MDNCNIKHLQEIEAKLDRTNRELNVLYEVSTAMRSTLQLKHILYIILTGVTSHSGLEYNRALLFLVNSTSRSLECKMAIGPESAEHANKIWTYIAKSKQNLQDLIQEDKFSQTVTQSSLYENMKDLNFPLNSNENYLLTKAYERGTPWHLSPEEVSSYYHDPLFNFFHTEEIIIMPLRSKDRVNGLIIADNIYTQKPITDDDMRIFNMLANQAGLAIENSHLYEMFVHKSYTDSLTNLWNHGFFQEELEKQLQKTKWTNTPLSLAMIDIDNFKILNDTYGHQNGDNILREVSLLLKESSRDMDYLCRYGGEEFSIILLETDQQQALDITERLRIKIEQHKFRGIDKNKDITLTVSIGLATFPCSATTKEDLIANADKAMYIAKFSGKNKISVAETDLT